MSYSKKKFVVFTVIAGNYDEIKQPLIIDDRFDYILFSDSVNEVGAIGVWTVLPIVYDSDKIWLKARYPRFNPHVVLPEYDAWLYIDGTIQITSTYVYDRCLELYNQGVDWAGMIHQSRDCIYDEMNALIGLEWVHDYDVLDWYRYLRKEQFPDHYGLLEDNIIFRSNTVAVKEISEEFWHIMEKYLVRRDQFILMYVLWKRVETVRTSCFLPAGQTAWNNEGCFAYYSHVLPDSSKILPKTFWEKLRYRYVKRFYGKDGDWEIYYTKWFDKLNKSGCPHLAMHIWTAWILVRYDLKFLLGRFFQRLAGGGNRNVIH